MRHRPPRWYGLCVTGPPPPPPDGMVPCLGEEFPQSPLKPKEFRTFVSCALNCAAGKSPGVSNLPTLDAMQCFYMSIAT